MWPSYNLTSLAPSNFGLPVNDTPLVAVSIGGVEGDSMLALYTYIKWRIVSVFIALSFFGGLITNTLTIATVLLVPSMRTVSNAYIANLEAIDLVQCLVGLSHATWVCWTLHQFPLMTHWFFCKLWAWLAYSTLMAAPLALITITLERYSLMTSTAPKWHGDISGTCTLSTNTTGRSLQTIRHHKKGLKAALVIGLTWLVPLGFTLLAVFDWWGHVEFNEVVKFCKLTRRTDAEKLYNSVQHGVAFFVCLLVMLYCYPIILYRLWSGNRSEACSQRQRCREMKTSLMIMVICVLYVLTYLPHKLVAILDVEYRYVWLRYLCYGVYSLNVLINAVVYAVMNRQFRLAYKLVLTCRWRLLTSQVHKAEPNEEDNKQECTSTLQSAPVTDWNSGKLGRCHCCCCWPVNDTRANTSGRSWTTRGWGNLTTNKGVASGSRQPTGACHNKHEDVEMVPLRTVRCGGTAK